MRRVLIISVAIAMGCGSDPTAAPADAGLDAASLDGAVTGDSGGADGAMPDGPTEGVTVTCWELELAINPDGSTLKWYGGLDALSPRTAVTITGVRWDRDGRLAGALLPGQRAEDTPLIQHRAHFELIPTAEEAALCGGGPDLVRGFEPADVDLEIFGMSAEGAWSGRCTVSAERVFITCHTGASLQAEGMAGNFPANPAIGFPEPYGDANVHVRTREPLAADFSVLELWVANEAGTLRRDLDPADLEHREVSADGRTASVFWAGSPHSEELCPSLDDLHLPDLVIGYRFSSGGAELSGIAQAGICQGR